MKRWSVVLSVMLLLAGLMSQALIAQDAQLGAALDEGDAPAPAAKEVEAAAEDAAEAVKDAAEDAAAAVKDAAEQAKAESAEGEQAKMPDKGKPSPEDEKMKEMQKEMQRLTAEYQLLMQRQKNDQLKMELEKQEWAAEQAYKAAQQEKELTEMKLEVARLTAQAALTQAKLAAELEESKVEVARIQAKQALDTAKQSEEVAELRSETAKLQAENMLLMEKGKHIQMQAAGIAQKYQEEMAAIEAKLQVKATREKLTATVVDQIEYLENPYKDGVVYVSDRRIPLNGVITTGTADYVCDRIDYFNNQSQDLPIFIVIDSSPGGSVMEGYRIVKAIETSRAPVHVVVKSFAASMAAIITTLAPHSYALPNAVILHHQMSSSMRGNLTQQEEMLESSKEWARRLAQPLADKMGVTMDRLVELMYENNSDGDWEEFADKAVELKWVNHVVHEIREQGIRDQPTEKAAAPMFFFEAGSDKDEDGRPVMQRYIRTSNAVLMEKVDNEGRPYIMLPRLRPFDYYFVYNPDRYYRWR